MRFRISAYLAVIVSAVTIFQGPSIIGSDKWGNRAALQARHEERRDGEQEGGTVRSRCLSLSGNNTGISSAYSAIPKTLDDLLYRHKQVFVAMPAKAAGTSLKEFTKKCMKRNDPDNFINAPIQVRKFLTASYGLPSIIASHLYTGDQPLIDLIQHASSRDAIIIYTFIGRRRKDYFLQ